MLALSPDGTTLAAATGLVELWRISDGTLLWQKQIFRAAVIALAFSPDGRTVATGSQERGGARLWRVADGQLLRTLQGHTESVESVAFSPDGKTLASGSRDRTIRLWGHRSP